MSYTLTKAAIIEKLNQKLHLSKQEATALLYALIKVMTISLVQNVALKISKFGNFVVLNKNERPGRNPATGESVPVSARRVVSFRPGQKFKARIEAEVK